jgi:hypothetical protein
VNGNDHRKLYFNVNLEGQAPAQATPKLDDGLKCFVMKHAYIERGNLGHEGGYTSYE